ncbi:amidohydrolase family protein [Oculatella sp. LEGE 06141]|uniref:amidohydrolase family protein n=1 Tax=Oculatella sp. LEGE 06141 TaxID=1828648 RepID=UPI001881ECAD|nr:amidohydrolase family protein [Oculatella sp. LEGE 06141]MBE9181137.1 amidohydrolase family protein [Oculatella sp. LEGE 06141]
MNLKLNNAQLLGRDGLWDVSIADDRIVDIAPHLSVVADRVIDAGGQLLIPGLVDAHMHLDKALLFDRCVAVTGDFNEAMHVTLQAKHSFTVADIQTRARRALKQAIAFGTTAMRSHVEVDPVIQVTGLEALLPLRDEYAWGLTLQLAVFAQEGITNQAGTVDLLQQAMAMGADVVGSAPYVDPDPEQNIRIIFDIAQEFDCDVDFHLDYLDDDSPMLLPFVVSETVRRGWQGRVCVGHMTKLAGLPPAELAAIAPTIQEADLSILALPASDVYIMARKDTHNVRRGVAPIHTLAQLGVNTAFAVNNVQNLFTPFGDGDVLKIATLVAQLLQLGTPAAHQLCLEMATTRAARAIGIHGYGIAPGGIADLVLLNATSVSEAIAAAPPGRMVIKRGQIVAQSKLEQQWFAETAVH